MFLLGEAGPGGSGWGRGGWSQEAGGKALPYPLSRTTKAGSTHQTGILSCFKGLFTRSIFSPSCAPCNRPFVCCPLNRLLNGLIGLKPILSIIQPITINTMLNKKWPVLKY